jgi:HlyD family secretion protein
LQAKKAEVEQLRGSWELLNREREALRVLAGIDGVLQEILVEVGQQVQSGETLGKVAVPGSLKAELRVPETQAKEVRVGIPVSVNTWNGVIPGTVQRIDPGVRGATVTVDVELRGRLPDGARPDLTIEGNILIDKLTNVLKMPRPGFGISRNRIGLFKVNSDGEAALTVVRIGRVSVSTVQVLEGLSEGDQVILSDMSDWQNYDRIRLR